MFGSIVGDIIGSRFETMVTNGNWHPLFDADCSFTDDTVLTVAVADALLSHSSFETAFRNWFHRYPSCEYGERFRTWASSSITEEQNSFGSGAVMRLAPVYYFATSVDEALHLATQITRPTHNHSDAIHAARTLAELGFRLKQRERIDWPAFISSHGYVYDADPLMNRFRRFDDTAVGVLTTALNVMARARNFEHAMKTCIDVGGDTDTICAVVGGLSELKFGLSNENAQRAMVFLPENILEVVDQFYRHHALTVPWELTTKRSIYRRTHNAIKRALQMAS